MYRNFIRVASANIKTKLLNVKENSNQIINYLEYAGKNDVDILVFPELTLTGISSGELISSKEICDRSIKELNKTLKKSKEYETIFNIGMPIRDNTRVYNCQILIQKGKILNIYAKENLSYDEKRYFTPSYENLNINFELDSINESFNLYNSNHLSINNNDFNLQIVFENDLLNNNIKFESNIILVPGSIATDMYKLEEMENRLISISKLTKTGIIYTSPSNYESSSYGCYSTQKYIIENGKTIEKGNNFKTGMIISEINIDETRNYEYHKTKIDSIVYHKTNLSNKEIKLRREINKYPYIPKENYDSYIKNILEIQSEALARRLSQLKDNKIFIGVSGGLDSTLGLIVASLAYFKLNLDSKDIYAITMPGLGTSKRTNKNAKNLSIAYDTTFMEIDIVDSVKQHFKDINHREDDFSITYENSQARERTQVLMDLSNKHGGIVLGTGNMSETALGWSTYNGDHMSMYNVNAGLPKTLLRKVVEYVANNTNDELLKNTLNDILDTPISPELLPLDNEGKISQKTEENVGAYELHDFFLYHFLRNRSKIDDIEHMANIAFNDKYESEYIKKILDKFVWRFLTQQFKRNTSVDHPQILDYSLNPRLGFVMPSDVDPTSFS